MQKFTASVETDPVLRCEKKEQIFGALAIALFLTVSPLLAETVRVGTFFNGNNSFLNSRAYIWSPSNANADITARVYALLRSGPSTLLGTVPLDLLNTRMEKLVHAPSELHGDDQRGLWLGTTDQYRSLLGWLKWL